MDFQRSPKEETPKLTLGGPLLVEATPLFSGGFTNEANRKHRKRSISGSRPKSSEKPKAQSRPGRVKRPPRPRLPVKLQAQLLDQHFPRIPRASGPAVQGWSPSFFLRGLGESSRASWARRFGGIGPLRNGESSSWCPFKTKEEGGLKDQSWTGLYNSPFWREELSR